MYRTKIILVFIPILTLLINAYSQLDLPAWPEDPPEDWTTFHLATPPPGNPWPGDPNGAIYYKGLYHLHQIYKKGNDKLVSWSHLSSEDMVYWKFHPTSLTPSFTNHGMFSGTAFYTKEGQPAIVYHGQESKRNHIVYALDDSLNQWTEPEAIVPLDENGQLPDIRHWDPDLWLMDDTYYAISGGKDPELMTSDDLKSWEYKGKLLHEDFPADLGAQDAVGPVTRYWDISCSNIFKIGNKWMLLAIDHGPGARYYLGDFVDGKYLPDYHAMMNWKQPSYNGMGPYFAPESMLTPDGRRVVWAWIVYGLKPSGNLSLPRELELPDDGVLRIKPLRELEKLRYKEISKTNLTVSSSSELHFDEPKGNAVEFKVVFKAPLPAHFGVNILGDDNTGLNPIKITAGLEKKTLDIGVGTDIISPPFELAEGEDLTLRIFVDNILVEVFANDRQAAIYTENGSSPDPDWKNSRKNPNLSLFTSDADVVVSKLISWNMRSIWDEPANCTNLSD